MGKETAISWTDHTINLWWGCSKVSAGCLNCYADTFSKRWGKDIWGPGKQREDHRSNAIKTALKLNRDAGRAFENFKTGVAAGADMLMPHRPRVFSASMSDWLDDEVPLEWLADLLDLIRRTPNLDWLLLTKRPENWQSRLELIRDRQRKTLTTGILLASGWLAQCPPDNVWIGTTVEDQTRADERIPALLKIPAKVRFLSCEPLLEKVDLMYPKSIFPDGPQRCCNGDECGCMGYPIDPPMIYGIHWLITGGESGPGFRPFNPDWARSLRDQCRAAGLAFHMKQMGGLRPGTMPPIPDDLMIREYPTP